MNNPAMTILKDLLSGIPLLRTDSLREGDYEVATAKIDGEHQNLLYIELREEGYDPLEEMMGVWLPTRRASGTGSVIVLKVEGMTKIRITCVKEIK